jgi:hypothetical protein
MLAVDAGCRCWLSMLAVDAVDAGCRCWLSMLSMLSRDGFSCFSFFYVSIRYTYNTTHPTPYSRCAKHVVRIDRKPPGTNSRTDERAGRRPLAREAGAARDNRYSARTSDAGCRAPPVTKMPGAPRRRRSRGNESNTERGEVAFGVVRRRRRRLLSRSARISRMTRFNRGSQWD